MSEKYVQVPVSLIERVEDELAYRVRTAVAMWRAKDRDGGDRSAAVEAEVRGGRTAVRALLSQPTPTAEPPATYEQGYDDGYLAGEHAVRNAETLVPAAPPSIADMAPGTTFVDSNGKRWTIRQDRDGDPWANSDSGDAWDLNDFDESTIRDVTPPKDAA